MGDGTLLFIRLWLISPWGTVSKALEMSIIVTTPPKSSFILVKALLRMAILFLQPSSCVNPFCLMCCFIFDRNLRSIIAEYILPSRDPMIDLQFSTSSALFPGLGISVVRLVFHCAGYIRCSMRRLHSLANTCSAPFFLRWNFFIWSAPAAVSDLIFLNFSTRLSRAIGVQISLISILLHIGWFL